MAPLRESRTSGREARVGEEDLVSFAREVLRTEAAAVGAVAERLGSEFPAAVRCIREAPGRVVVTGAGKSGLVARKIASTMAGTGTPGFFLHAGDALHGDLGAVRDGDVLVVVSRSGRTDEITAVISSVGRLSVPLIAICGNVTSPLAAVADVVLDASVLEEACPHGVVPTASTTAALALGDALALALCRLRGLGRDDLGLLHPGGALGRHLLWRVRDVMCVGEAAPTLEGDRTLGEAMSLVAYRRGTVAVVDGTGRLEGVLTAGDLTRFAADVPDFLSRPVSEAMNRWPRTASAQDRAASALDAMESTGIMAMPVVERGTVVGMVHLHDLLRAGVRA